MVMERMEGSLAAKLKEADLNVVELAKAVGRDILRALKYCDELGIMHCDVKPENVLLTGTGTYKRE